MSRIAALSHASNTLRLLALCLSVVLFHGCAASKKIQVGQEKKPLVLPALPATEIERNEFSLARGEEVVGRLAFIRLGQADTLPDIARHFSLGIDALSAANPGVDIWVPKAGERILLPLSFILPDAPREGIVVNLATMRLFQFKGDGDSLSVSTYPVGVGTDARPTPTGRMYVARKTTRPTWHVPASIAEEHRRKGDPLPAKVLPGPLNPLGDFALYLSKASYLIHGTNKPASVGLKATNGCLRLYPEDVKVLYDETPVKTPVLIVNQPYLLGQRGGVLFLEAHAPMGDTDVTEAEKIRTQLKNLEKQTGRPLDWTTIEKVLAEGRGIPVPIFAIRPGSLQDRLAESLEVEHPGQLHGRPEIPALRTDAWYVLAANVHEEIDALRTAAIIRHQGPSIPARVLAKKDGYCVVAGPFIDNGEARDAAKRLKIDLGIDGVLLEVSAREADPAAKKGI